MTSLAYLIFAAYLLHVLPRLPHTSCISTARLPHVYAKPSL
ncbi:hypothetical protein [Scardovia inopinata]|nr:hypothetical protein [Scardovia inopinata]